MGVRLLSISTSGSRVCRASARACSAPRSTRICVVGWLAMLSLLVALIRACRRAARRSRDLLASLPGVWVAASIGALAGEGLFGGTPLAATFWLVAGVAVAIPLIDREAS